MIMITFFYLLRKFLLRFCRAENGSVLNIWVGVFISNQLFHAPCFPDCCRTFSSITVITKLIFMIWLGFLFVCLHFLRKCVIRFTFRFLFCSFGRDFWERILVYIYINHKSTCIKETRKILLKICQALFTKVSRCAPLK